MRRLTFALALTAVWGMAAVAQTTPAPPSPTLPAPSASELGDLVRRLRDLEEANKKLVQDAGESKRLREDLQDLSKKYDDLSRRVEGRPATPTTSAASPLTGASPTARGPGNDVNTFVGGGGVRWRVVSLWKRR